MTEYTPKMIKNIDKTIGGCYAHDRRAYIVRTRPSCDTNQTTTTNQP